MSKILIVDDSDLQRRLIVNLLKRSFSHSCIEADSAAAALSLIGKDTAGEIFTVLLDLSMPGIDGRDAIPLIHKMRPHMPIIVITSTQDVKEVVAVLKSGAFDYLVKPPNPELLHNAVQKAEHFAFLQQEIARLRGESGGSGFAALVGKENAAHTYIKLGKRAAASDITVLITGESGAGKEILARAIHSESARHAKPFVAVNCGALPKDLVESALFGHVKGAFTDAVADSIGKFREAEGGTLFLDEIGELPLPAQVKLLRALQQREVEPVGGGKPIAVNIRIIAATNRDPAQAVLQGFFREDLYYRLNVFPIHIPPLRHRTEDIPVLADFFLQRYAAQEKKHIEGFDSEAQKWMIAHSWPGNARELENRVYRGVLLCEGGYISVENMSPPLDSGMQAAPAVTTSASGLILSLLTADGELKSMAAMNHEIEQAALHFCEGNMSEAARKLGVGKSTLYRHRHME